MSTARSAAATQAQRPQLQRTRLHVVLIGTPILAALVGMAALVVGWAQTGTGLATFDQPLLAWMISVRTPAAEVAVTAFTNLGQTLPMFAIGLPLTIALFWRYRRLSIWVLMVVAPLGSTSLASLLKLHFAHPRPPLSDAVAPYETDFSLPSGHTTGSTVVAGMLAYLTFWLARRTWVRVAAVIAAITWAVAMGISRIYLGHHWLTDVAFGWLLGLSWLTFLVLAHQLLLPAKTPEITPEPAAATPN